MSEDTRSEITGILLADGASMREVIDALPPRLYDELREIARRHLARESVGHTLNTSDLVHDADRFRALLPGEDAADGG